MTILRYAIVSCLVLFHLAGAAQTLWGKSQYGMTVKQVLELFPEGKAPVKPGQLSGGLVEKHRLPGVQIVNKTFTAEFYFLDDRLAQVRLVLEKPQNRSATLRTFESLTEALRAKYGSEISRNRSDTSLFYSVESTWLSGRTNILMYALGVGDKEPLLTISYQVRLAKEADKL